MLSCVGMTWLTITYPWEGKKRNPRFFDRCEATSVTDCQSQAAWSFLPLKSDSENCALEN